MNQGNGLQAADRCFTIAFISNPRWPFDGALMRFVLSVVTVLSLVQIANGADSWWQLLGPLGNGHFPRDQEHAEALPTEWTDRDNIAWKTRVHDRGWSSPVILGDQVWMTTATADGRNLYAICVNKDSGEVVFDKQVFEVDSPQKISVENTYATPTPVVHRNRVFVHFGTYGMACLDAETAKVVWTRRDLKCDHETNAGPASSPTIIDGNVVVHVDGRDVQYIIALNSETGQTVWKTQRSFDMSRVPVHQRKAYSMPGIAPRGDYIQLVSSAGQGVYSYDTSGKELWRVRHTGFSIAPRPIAGHGMVYVIIDRDHPELWAISHDGSGDVTDSHVIWKEKRGMPARCSPLLVDDLLYLVNREGIMTCLEAVSGEVVWKQRLDGRFSATPLYACGRIYLFNENARCLILRPGRKFKVIANSSLAEQELMASPAVDGNAIYVRTASYLYKIESGKQRAVSSDPTNEFVGDWDIGLPTTGGQPKFVMSLREDFTARKSHVPRATGIWKLVNGEARVVWSDGWRDIIRNEGDRYRKIAFGPGDDFDSKHSNTDSAKKRTD